MNFKLYFALLALLFLALLSTASLQCNFVNIDFDSSMQATQETQVIYTFAFSNTGLAQEAVQLYAQCPQDAECSFDSSSFQLPSGQNSISHLFVTGKTKGDFEIPIQVSTISQTCNAILSMQVLQSQQQQSPTGSVSEALSVKLAGGDVQVNARPGDSAKYEFELKNNLKKKIFVTLKNGVNPFKDSTFFEFNDVELQPGQTKTINARVVIPPGTPGGEFTAALVADGQDCCGKTFEFPITITVHGSKISLDLQSGQSTEQCTKVNKGEEISIPFSIRNNEEITGPFKLITKAKDKNAKLLITTKNPSFTLEKNTQLDSAVVIKTTNLTTLDTYKYALEGKYNQFTFLQREYCVEVIGFSNSEISNVDKYKLSRGSLEEVHFNLTNTGNNEDEFALTLPNYARFTALELDLPVVTLKAKESKQLVLVIGTDLYAPLGDLKLPIRVDSKTQGESKVFNFNFSFYSSGELESSIIDLTLQDNQIRVSKGQIKHFTFYASNFGEEKLRDAQVTVSGVPSDWTSSEVIDIEPGESKQLTVAFNVPLSEERTNIPIQLTLKARNLQGLEETITKTAALLTPSSDLTFLIRKTSEIRNFNGEVTSIVLDLIVTNNGQETLTDVTPAILADEDSYLLSYKSSQLQLAPSQTGEVQVAITPKTSSQSQDVELQFEAGEVFGEVKAIKLPAMTISTGNTTALKLLAILLLLIGISYLLVKEQS